MIFRVDLPCWSIHLHCIQEDYSAKWPCSDSVPTSYFSDPGAAGFKVRGPNYLSDKLKVRRLHVQVFSLSSTTHLGLKICVHMTCICKCACGQVEIAEGNFHSHSWVDYISWHYELLSASIHTISDLPEQPNRFQSYHISLLKLVLVRFGNAIVIFLFVCIWHTCYAPLQTFLIL